MGHCKNDDQMYTDSTVQSKSMRFPGCACNVLLDLIVNIMTINGTTDDVVIENSKNLYKSRSVLSTTVCGFRSSK